MSSAAPNTDSIQPPDANGEQTQEGRLIKPVGDETPPTEANLDGSGASTIVDVAPADAETAKALQDRGVKEGDLIQAENGDTLRIGSTTPPDIFTKPHSKTPATCGRVVLVYSTEWIGPRPGFVVHAWGVSGDRQLLNVNVQLDCWNDKKAMSQFAQGGLNTVSSVGLYDPLTPDERSAMTNSRPNNGNPIYWCEWMPFQKGQAAKVDDFGPRIERLERALSRFLSDPSAVSADVGHLEACHRELQGSPPESRLSLP